MRFDSSRLKGFGQAVKAGGDWCGGDGRVGHSGIENGIDEMPLGQKGDVCNFIRQLQVEQRLLNAM